VTAAPPPALDWRPYTDRLERLELLFGLPADWVARLTVPRAIAPFIHSWLRILEATARRLLLALAAQMAAQRGPRPPAQMRRANADPALERAETLTPDGSDPDSSRWRGVVFLTARPETASVGWDSHAPWLADASCRTRSGGVPALPLALRYEALRRIARDPERFARRRLRSRPAARSKLAPPRRPAPPRRAAGRPVDPGRGPRIRRLDSG
jgi:hypothetical protein